MSGKYITKKSIQKMKDMTNKLYQQAIEETFGCNGDYLQIAYQIRLFEMGLDVVEEGFGELVFKAKELYLKKMCELPTQDLELIVRMHVKKKFKRAEKTIEYINNELTRRLLFNDSNENTGENNEK